MPGRGRRGADAARGGRKAATCAARRRRRRRGGGGDGRPAADAAAFGRLDGSRRPPPPPPPQQRRARLARARHGTARAETQPGCAGTEIPSRRERPHLLRPLSRAPAQRAAAPAARATRVRTAASFDATFERHFRSCCQSRRRAPGPLGRRSREPRRAMASVAAFSGLAAAARGSNGVSVAEARRHMQNMESFRKELPHAHEHDKPGDAPGGLKEEETAGQLRRVFGPHAAQCALAVWRCRPPPPLSAASGPVAARGDALRRQLSRNPPPMVGKRGVAPRGDALRRLRTLDTPRCHRVA